VRNFRAVRKIAYFFRYVFISEFKFKHIDIKIQKLNNYSKLAKVKIFISRRLSIYFRLDDCNYKSMQNALNIVIYISYINLYITYCIS